jgi:hypothetical protein
MRVINTWIRLLHATPEMSKKSLSRGFFKRAFSRLCGFFDFADDVYMEDAYDSLFAQLHSKTGAPDSFVPSVIEAEVRSPRASLMQRVWAMTMKMKMS